MKYEVRFIKTQVLDNPIVEAKDEKEAVEKALRLIHKYDFKDYETTEVIEVDDETADFRTCERDGGGV